MPRARRHPTACLLCNPVFPLQDHARAMQQRVESVVHYLTPKQEGRVADAALAWSLPDSYPLISPMHTEHTLVPTAAPPPPACR
jgi:hypothetical protein